MAIYVYKCAEHGLFEHVRGFSDPDPTCACGAAVVRSFASENAGFSFMGGREMFHDTTIDSRRKEFVADCERRGLDPKKDFTNVSKAWV